MTIHLSHSLLILVFVGAIAGWLSGLCTRGRGFGLIGNIVVGVCGALFAGWLFPRWGIAVGHGWMRDIFHAFMGSLLLLGIVHLLRRTF